MLVENARMLEMCDALGFEIRPDPEDLSVRKVLLKLPAPLRDVA